MQKQSQTLKGVNSRFFVYLLFAHKSFMLTNAFYRYLYYSRKYLMRMH